MLVLNGVALDFGEPTLLANSEWLPILIRLLQYDDDDEQTPRTSSLYPHLTILAFRMRREPPHLILPSHRRRLHHLFTTTG